MRAVTRLPSSPRSRRLRPSRMWTMDRTTAVAMSVASITRLYQRVRRVRIVSVTRSVLAGDEGVPFAAERPDHRLALRIVDLPPQSLHVDVDHVRERIVRSVPHVFGDLGPADDLPRMSYEVLEQRVLAHGQPQSLSAF